MRLSISFAIALTIALAWAAPASAGRVCQTGGIATFGAADTTACGGVAGTGETNALSVSVSAGGAIVFTDSNPIDDADGPTGCSVSGNTATCPGALAFQFDLGDGDDSGTVATVASDVVASTGGAGKDQLTGGPLDDSLDGGPGDDVVAGGGGDDDLFGGLDNDTLSGDAGNDALHGGPGTDALKGGVGADELNGDDGPDSLDGEAGADTLLGGAGDDAEQGGDGNDALDGGPARRCIASGGDDQLSGGSGQDALCGGAGPAGRSDNDALGGGPGEDTAFYVRAANVTVALDGAAGDGEAGESDNVAGDVENITSGEGADTLRGNDARNVLDGGGNADLVSGSGGNDVLTDSGGDSAADRLEGGDGDDLLAGGAGGDAYIGGDGEDGVTDYAGRSSAVAVTLDGAADDGAAGEGDNVSPDVEDVTGGSAADTIVGSAADNELTGGAGDDSISGGDGNDGLSGGAGRDTVDGGAGRDDIEGGGGADTLKSQDGLTDRVNCAGGTDAAQVDARDDVAGNCESVTVGRPSAVAINSVTVTRAGFVVVKVTCSVVERSCAGAIIVKTVRRVARRFIKLGQVNYRVRSGQSKVFRAKIAVRDRKPLRRARRVKVRAVVTNVNADTGDSTNATKLATVTTRGLR